MRGWTTIPGTGGQQTSPVASWSCDADGCPERTIELPTRQAADEGWWERHGVHLCPNHNPNR